MDVEIRRVTNIAQLVVHGRGLLEAMDELKDTNLYSQRIKNLAKSLERELEKHEKISTSDEFANGLIQTLAENVDDFFEAFGMQLQERKNENNVKETCNSAG